ncbi:hypothetical protein Tco_1261392 [Tanacetum coccineum]
MMISPKKSRGKGSQGKKTEDVSQESVDVSEESEPEPAKKNTSSRSTRGIVIQDPPSAPKPKPTALKLKLKGVQSLTPEEQEAADIMKALKESKKTNRRQPGTGGSSEGTCSIPGVSNESTVVSTTSSEGTGTKPGVPDEEKVTSEENVILEWGSEQESDYSKEDQGNDEEVDWIDFDDDEEKKDDTNDDKRNTEVEESGKGDAEISDVAKADAEKIEEIKDDAKKAELPPTSSSLFVSLGFGDQFLKHSSDTYLSPSVLTIPVSVISEPIVPTPMPVTPLVDLATTLLTPSPVSTIPPVPHQTIAPIPTPLITTDAPTITTAVPKSDALSAKHSVKPVPESSKIQTPTINLEQRSEKSASKILKIKREQAEKQKMPKYTIKSTDKAALKEYDQKSTLYQPMHKNKSFNRNPANHTLKHDDDKDPPVGPNQGKDPSKGSKTGKSASAKEPVKEPIVEVVMDDAVNTAGEDCFNALTYKLDWNNPEGDRYPFDLSKPLPLQGYPGHLTVDADYFFNNDLEYLKSFDPERMYIMSITKTKASQYEIVGIEDMVPTLWSTIKHVFDKDVAKGIKH